MSAQLLKTGILVSLFLTQGHPAWPQVFVNLDFESPIQPLPSFPGFVPTTNALPGWEVYGFPGPGYVLYNTMVLDGAGVSLFGPGPQGGWSQILRGSYSVLLQGSSDGAGPSGAALGQTGQIPPNAKSLRFFAKPFTFAGTFSGEPIFQVTFGGQPISLVDLGSTASYDILGGDISAFAGETGQLLFTAPPNHIGVLDNILFSTETIPEPAPLFLLPTGLVCLGALRRRLSRAGGASRFRKQIQTLVLAIGIFASLSLTPRLHAQGSVFLNNYDSGMGLYVQLDEGSPIIPAPAGTSVMIFGGSTAASMAPITNSAGQSVFTVSPAGVELRGLGSGSYFDAGTGAVPGVPSNGTAFFAIHAWAYAPSFWDAVGYGVWRMSGVWQQAVGAPGAALPLNIPGEYAIILTPSIPEPSTVAVAALGLAGWLAFRRRKSRQ